MSDQTQVFVDSGQTPGPLTLERTLQLLDEFCAIYPVADNIDFRICATQEELYGPQASRDRVGTIQGGYIPATRSDQARQATFRGQCDLAYSSFRDEIDFGRCLHHEIAGHFGLNTCTADEKRAVLESILLSRQEPGIDELWARVNHNYADQPDLKRAEELYCTLAEELATFPAEVFETTQTLRQLGIAGPRNLQIDELRSVVAHVATGLHENTRDQVIFPVDRQAQFSKSTDFTKPLTLERSKELVIEFCKTYPVAYAIKFKIRATQEELYGPNATRANIGTVFGAYVPATAADRGVSPVYRGRCDLAYSVLGGAENLSKTLRHEIIGHFGLNTFSADDKRGILESISLSQNQDGISQKWIQAKRDYGDAPDLLIAEEVFCSFAENLNSAPALNSKSPTALKRIQSSGPQLLDAQDIRSIVAHVADGLHDRSLDQVIFPVDRRAQFSRTASDKADKKPFHEVVANELISQIEAGTAPWQKPWNADGGIGGMPLNPTTGKRYKGINAIHLLAQGHSDPRWLTYKQAVGLDAQVKKGERGTSIQYWKFEDTRIKTDESGKPVMGSDGTPVQERFKLQNPRIFYATVFNAEQIEGLAPLVVPELRWDPVERAEKILTNSGARIEHAASDRAYYSPSRDEIHLPLQAQFPSARNYYATALHELGHWTGHESRLKRDLSHPFRSEGYAREELRAEIASMMLSAELGLPHDPSQHAAYVSSWVSVLKKDPLEIFRAAADAEKIHALAMSFAPELNQASTQSVTRSISSPASQGKDFPEQSEDVFNVALIPDLTETAAKETFMPLQNINHDAVHGALNHMSTESKKLISDAWNLATPNGSSSYLAKKGVGAFGTAATPSGALLVPMRSAEGEIRNLQRLEAPGADGKTIGPANSYLVKDEPIAGLHHLIGSIQPGNPIVFSADYADAAAIHQSTGHPVVVTFSDNNTPKVVEHFFESANQAQSKLVLHVKGRVEVDTPNDPFSPLYSVGNIGLLVAGGSEKIEGFKQFSGNSLAELMQQLGGKAVKKLVNDALENITKLPAKHDDTTANQQVQFSELENSAAIDPAITDAPTPRPDPNNDLNLEALQAKRASEAQQVRQEMGNGMGNAPKPSIPIGTSDFESAPFLGMNSVSATAPAQDPSSDNYLSQDLRALRERLAKEYQFDGVSKYFYRQGKQDLAFEDKGSKFNTPHHAPEVAASIAQLAHAKGWREMYLTGTAEFCREMWLQASLLNMKVIGYEPEAIDQVRLTERKQLLAKDQASKPTDEVPASSKASDQIPNSDPSPTGTGSAGGPSSSHATSAPSSPPVNSTPAPALLSAAAAKQLDSQLRDVLIQKGANDPQVMEMTLTKLYAQVQSPRVYLGKLLEHGPAPYKFDPKEQNSYFVKLQTQTGPQTVWGVDLPRALAEMLPNADSAIGQDILLAFQGVKKVQTLVPQKDASGQPAPEKWELVDRNTWFAQPVMQAYAQSQQELTQMPSVIPAPAPAHTSTSTPAPAPAPAKPVQAMQAATPPADRLRHALAQLGADPLQAEITLASVQSLFASPKFQVGQLLEHGQAPLQFTQGQPPSYYLKLSTEQGPVMLWSADFPRAINNNPVQLGQTIVAAYRGIELVQDGTRPATPRNDWLVAPLERLHDDAQQGVIQRMYNAQTMPPSPAPAATASQEQHALYILREAMRQAGIPQEFAQAAFKDAQQMLGTAQARLPASLGQPGQQLTPVRPAVQNAPVSPSHSVSKKVGPSL
jgi:antirestriction protein ArdC